MGTFIQTYGELHIPDENWPAFLEDAKKLALQGGLFSKNYVMLFGKGIWTLSFPEFNDEDDDADFLFSAYEERSWENAGIDIENHGVYSNKIGWNRFNLAIQALYLLAEIYSDTPFVSGNDSLNCPDVTIKWMRYVLDRDIQYTWRKDLWKVYELVEESHQYSGAFKFGEFLAEFQGDSYYLASAVDVLFVIQGMDELIQSCTEKKDNYKDDEVSDKNTTKGEKTISNYDVIVSFINGVKQYKNEANIPETEQIQWLLRHISYSNKQKLGMDQSIILGIRCGVVILSPVTAVKIIADAYDKDFWELWNSVRNTIENKRDTFYTSQLLDNHDRITTKDFFSLDDEGRFMWWLKDKDKRITNEDRELFDALYVRLRALENDTDDGFVIDWQKRFVNCLAARPNIYCFEHTFLEFLAYLNKKRYRAAVLLLEEAKDDEYEKLLMIYAYPELRKKVLHF